MSLKTQVIVDLLCKRQQYDDECINTKATYATAKQSHEKCILSGVQVRGLSAYSTVSPLRRGVMERVNTGVPHDVITGAQPTTDLQNYGHNKLNEPHVSPQIKILEQIRILLVLRIGSTFREDCVKRHSQGQTVRLGFGYYYRVR